MKDALKVVRNNNPKKQLYKKDPSIPNHQADLNTCIFEISFANKWVKAGLEPWVIHGAVYFDVFQNYQ
ncbi:hypothetical protein [uncultured Shewanella sp.]|uniref:hypothetical protein n=1 Tax=uncultured Shewanella sp. TaxID=173975 RepID=UPI0026338F8F|nr:hypothetical protein [uncultured Shewanella sp.]